MRNSIPSSIASISIFFFTIYCPLIYSQQLYIRRAASSCSTTDTSTSALGYTCNGLSRSCLTYLTFRAQPPFNSVPAVSNLFSVPPSRLARLNSLPQNSTLQTNRMLLVPVPCSCSGQYYQANTSFEIEHHDTYLSIANNTFQGLSTCQALRAQNSNLSRTLYTATRITVPLRCACPTKNQSDDGVEYLLTYLITWKQSVSSISQLFNVDIATTLAANKLSEQDFTIYPFTTLLIPLKNPPSSPQVSSAPPPPPPPSVDPPPSSPPPRRGGGSGKPWIYTAVGVVGGLVLASAIAATVFYWFFVVKQRRRRTEHVITSAVEKHTPDDKSIIRIPHSTKAYTIEELEAATENFSPKFLIKGSVYRGIINGDFVAIKKMSGDVSQELIKILDKMNHFNLIRLSGACFHQGFWYLVYEYAANGSLRDWIRNHSNGGKILKWNERLQIVLDIAQGLNYLHNYTCPPLVHKDLSSSNVVLDQDLRAKITNLGLARSAEGQEGQFALTRHIVGTQGFMAPEYLENGLVSPMLDVYAFGVVMLEIFTGKEASLLCEEVDLHLSEILAPVVAEEEDDDDDRRKEKAKLLMDPLLEGNYPPQFAVIVLELILKCINKDVSDRPTTDDIVLSLSRISVMFE